MKERFYSLDVFRGATVALMILVNNPGSWSHIYTPLEHAPWHGATPTDLVFPFFLFAVGNALAFVMPRLEVAGNSVFWRKILKRTFLIFFIGLMLNWMPFVKWDNDHIVFKPWQYIDADGNPAGVRILGVLQRIALAYFFASIIIYFFKIRGAFVAAGVILLGYWFLCVAANPSDPFSLHGWFGTAVDRSILGDAHMYHGELENGKPVVFDPEGLMSLFAAIVQVIFGYFAGDYIIKKGKTHEMVNGLFVAGCVLVFAGFCWDMIFPINKKVWTSSYTIYTTGLALLTLSVLIYIIEFKKWRGWWSRFFDVFGKNPLFIFVLSGVLPRLLALIRIPNGLNPQGKPVYLSPFGWFYEHICKPVSSNLNNGSLLYAICMILFMWLIVWWMDKKKIYVKV
ncbi:MAG: heparan-alpha-glucosaminide N-acetyltransferase domain-containing protein [Ginsengibacter sp.]